MRVVLDLEANALNDPSEIWCICIKDIDTGKTFEYTHGTYQAFQHQAKDFTQVIGHNIIAYDLVHIRNLLGVDIPGRMVIDTLILSHLFHFSIPGGHSLEAWGERLKHAKVGLNISDWSVYSDAMVDRCRNDVELNEKLYTFLRAKLDRKEFWEAIRVEHDVARICCDLRSNGFAFDLDRAKELDKELRDRLSVLETELQAAFPPKLKVTQLKTKVKVEQIPFNPASPKQIVERLDEAGWKPTNPTATGKSWKVDETNLATLPDEAPKAAHRLVEYLLLVARTRTLKQWFDAYDIRDKRIHGRFRSIGTWTHRMAHVEPNMGNVSAEKSIKYKGEYLKQLATDLGGRMRRLWICGDDNWLVGTDAEGIQLRIFAHYIDDKEFTNSVISGKKENGTDPHSLNAAILGCGRDTAKTFIYAFLLGAGDGKLAEVLGVDREHGRASKERFIAAYPGLERLKRDVIPRDARRGYFQGFDGRLVPCDSEHLMLAGYLQNGEACIMKHANVLWRKELDERLLRRERNASADLPDLYKQVNFVHDEWQTEVRGSREAAEYVGRLQADSIKRTGESFQLRCPMAGQYALGKNWLETH